MIEEHNDMEGKAVKQSLTIIWAQALQQMSIQFIRRRADGKIRDYGFKWPRGEKEQG